MTSLRAGLGEWFRQRPRRHGEAIHDRLVSPLELFYDLVYVVCIGQAAHTLAGDVSWTGLAQFLVVFGMIWVVWMNGTLYHELHGREDGRSRSFMFLQMLLLALLSVFTAHAATSGHGETNDGRAFALTYTALLVVLTWLWYQVQRADAGAYRSTTTHYLAGMGVTIVGVLVSAALPAHVRPWIWAALVVGWILFVWYVFTRADTRTIGVTITHSMIERFGLLVIIVLGEVVIGVVDGLTGSSRDTLAIVTGLLGLTIGFGLWWNYFDLAGNRCPRSSGMAFSVWLFAHAPLTAAIAASGAGMVELVEHAHDGRTKAPTAWLMAGSVAAMLVCLALVVRSLLDWWEYHEYSVVAVRWLVIAAGVAIVVGALRPTPWLLALLLSLTLLVPWWMAFVHRVRNGYGPAPLAPTTKHDEDVASSLT